MTISTRSAADLDDARARSIRTDLALEWTSHRGRRRTDTDLRRYLLILGQLGLLIALTYAFQLESEAFRRLLVLTAGGFAAHYFLPLRYRLGFFVALSLAGIGMVLGPVEAAWLIGIGLALIGVCHLPISLCAGRRFSGVRRLRWRFSASESARFPWSSALWPILGSMFVFRLIIYFYDRSHESVPPRLSQTLGYFFLLPNVCFPLFPVVDFKKFCRALLRRGPSQDLSSRHRVDLARPAAAGSLSRHLLPLHARSGGSGESSATSFST